MADNNGNGRFLSVTFWMRVAAISFGLWSLVLPISAKLVTDRISEIAVSQRQQAAEVVAYRELMERRVLLLEERQADVRARLLRVEDDCARRK